MPCDRERGWCDGTCMGLRGIEEGQRVRRGKGQSGEVVALMGTRFAIG